MLEGLALAVYVGQEMFRSLGQVHNSLQVDDLLGGIGYRGERLRQQL